MNKPKVLFLCTGNSARSQIAEAFLRKHAGESFDVYSAGIEPKEHILPEVVQAMEEQGISLAGQKPKSVREYLGKAVFAYVITVCTDAEENCPAVFLTMGKHEHWPFDDPAKFEGSPAEKLQRTRQVRDRIEQKILRWLGDQDS